ncbi:MAG: hypothetical protein CMJ76_06685 [Planctomycetaceae bacterium]|nr:hypothetical protein [Planctomycetaceae bacterium]
MKRFLALGAICLALSTVGCAQNQMRSSQHQMMQNPMQATQASVQAPAPQHGYPHNHMLQNAQPSQTGTYAYPYYTTRSPRDFLQSNPPTIGR